MKRLIRPVMMIVACALSLQLTGCAQISMTPPQATIENAAKLRDNRFAPAAVGSFKLDAGKAAGLDKSISIRSNGLSSPIENSFAQYLRETLKVEIQSAGLFDANASTVISGTLTESTLDSSIGAGKASLAARFVVTRAGDVRYDSEQRVSAAWDSPFIGVAAVPFAAGQYEALYRKLVGVLLDDASFRRAIAKTSEP